MKYVETYKNHEIKTEFNGCSDVFMFVPANRGKCGAYAYVSSLADAHAKIDTVVDLMALDHQQYNRTCPRDASVGMRFASWEHYSNHSVTVELIDGNVTIGRTDAGDLRIYIDCQDAGFVGGKNKTAAEFLQSFIDHESAWKRLAINAGREE